MAENRRDLTGLEEKLGYRFRDPALLEAALVHSSYANERHIKSNERLEFLGDAVLGLVAANHFFHTDRGPEGELTQLRAGVVCEGALFSYAQDLGLGDWLMLGKGEQRNGGARRPAIVADAFEAVTAAIYLDGGMEAARAFLLPFLEREAANQRRTHFKDYKTRLQEIVQQNPGETLSYRLVGESGPDHDKRFTMEVHLNSNVVGVGHGRTKQEAEQQAAREALKLMGEE